MNWGSCSCVMRVPALWGLDLEDVTDVLGCSGCHFVQRTKALILSLRKVIKIALFLIAELLKITINHWEIIKMQDHLGWTPFGPCFQNGKLSMHDFLLF